MSAVQNETRKRNKKHYKSGHKRFKRSRELEVGMQGILITCNNNNHRPCTAEALNLLGEYADKLYGPELQDDFETIEEREDEEEEDVDDALKKEVAQLKAHRSNEERRFQVIDSGAYNVIFIRTQNIDPDKLVHYILTDLYTTKKKKSRLILRMLPVIGTCRAYQEDIVKYLTLFLEPWFKAPNSTTYKIAYKARNNNQNKREEIIHNIAGVLGNMNHENKVNLMNPELTVIIEVIKAVCCVCVVKDYQLYRKYNVCEIVKGDAPKPDVVTTKTEAEMTEKHSEKESDKEGSKVDENVGKNESRDEKEMNEGKDEVRKGDDDGEENGKDEGEVRKGDDDGEENGKDEDEVRKGDDDDDEEENSKDEGEVRKGEGE